MQKDLADFVLRFDLDAKLFEGRFEGPVFLDQRERLLRPDSFHALVEVRPDQQAHVDEFFARDAQVRQRGLEGDLLRLDVHVDVLPRQLPATGDREVLHEPRRAEQQGVEILRGRRVRHPGPGHRARLRFPFCGRLAGGVSEGGERCLRWLPLPPGAPPGFPPFPRGGRDTPFSPRPPPLALRAALDLASGHDRSRLEPRRLSVEDEGGLDPRGDEVRDPVDDSGQVGRHASLVIHQWGAVRLADDREELVERVEGVDREDFAREILERPRFGGDDVREVDAHPLGRGRGILKRLLGGGPTRTPCFSGGPGESTEPRWRTTPIRGPGPSVGDATRTSRAFVRGWLTAFDMYCFISNTSETSAYHAIDPLSGGMSRMGTTPTIAFLVLAVAALVALPHTSASVTVRDLGTLPGYTSSEALGINAAGQIVGTSSGTESQSRPFLCDDGVMTDLGTLGGSRGTAHGISNTGLIVGESVDATHTMHAFVWESGTMTDLGPGVAFAVNDQGQAVGCGYPTSPAPPCHAVLWHAGRMTDLGTLGGHSGSAYGINNAGQIVGSSLAPDGFMHAFLWHDGTMTDLGGLPGYQFSVAWDINRAGQVVGSSYGYDGTTHAVLWENGGGRNLGTPGGRATAAFGINDAGPGVGIRFSP